MIENDVDSSWWCLIPNITTGSWYNNGITESPVSSWHHLLEADVKESGSSRRQTERAAQNHKILHEYPCRPCLQPHRIWRYQLLPVWPKRRGRKSATTDCAYHVWSSVTIVVMTLFVSPIKPKICSRIYVGPKMLLYEKMGEGREGESLTHRKFWPCSPFFFSVELKFSHTHNPSTSVKVGSQNW